MTTGIGAPGFFPAVADALAETSDPAAVQVAEALADLPGIPLADTPSSLPALLHLDDALAAGSAHPVVDSLSEDSARRLAWQAGDMAMPAAFVGRYAFVEILGPHGMVPHERHRLGLYLQTPDIFYPPHRHAAEELYYVLSGIAEWHQGEAPAFAREPGTLLHHLPWEPHSTRTLSQPLLAVWAWLGDLRFETYEILPEWR